MPLVEFWAALRPTLPVIAVAALYAVDVVLWSHLAAAPWDGVVLVAGAVGTIPLAIVLAYLTMDAMSEAA